ncbi:hypothetical protein F2Q70_00023407 [Brassica cretica]|uniref:Uncharacterized protein n=1 Tax=Brassica cretica TaxID=69181 RepID=A0A8S9GRY8_BRACR|nr:hypothetical protein F2Q70_00023407 [Brassica cretica]
MGTRDWSRDQSRDIKTNNNLRLATCDQSQVACYATSKRTTTCDLRSVAGRMSQVAGDSEDEDENEENEDENKEEGEQEQEDGGRKKKKKVVTK